MRRGKDLSQCSRYRLRLRRMEETAAIVQYSGIYMDLHRWWSTRQEVVNSGNTSDQVSGEEVEDSPVLHSASTSPVSGPSTTTAVKYPVMRLNSPPPYNHLNLSMLPPPTFQHHKGDVDVILMAIQSLREEIKVEMEEMRGEIREAIRGLRSRFENMEKRVTALDGQINICRCDVLHKADNQSPRKPRWRPWFPLKTTTELFSMENNLQNENCRADVVCFAQKTPAGTMNERTKCCLARIISDDLSRNLSWQKAPNRHPFWTTCLWATILETLAATASDQELARKECVAWFENARDRSGGRSRRRFTCPDMPLLEKNSENIDPEEEHQPLSKSFL